MKRYLLVLAAALTALLVLGLTFGQANGQEVRFYTASWCGPCQAAKPAMAVLASEGISVRTIDVSNGGPAHITRVPSYEFVDAGGKVVQRWTGDAPVQAIRQLWSRKSGPADEPQPVAMSSATRVCRIQVKYVGGQYRQGSMYGTGCYVTNGKDNYIQSCAHNFRPDPGETITGITAHFPNGITVPCKVIELDEEHDLARLVPLKRLPLVPLVATGQMEDGEIVRWYGYGKGWKMRTGLGRADTAQLDHGYANLNRTAGPGIVQGDSGGPIINADGEVVGVLWGFREENNGRVYLACRRTYQTFFGIQRQVIRQRVVDPPTLNPRPQPAPRPAPAPQPNTPPNQCDDCYRKVSQLVDLHADLLVRVENVERGIGNFPKPQIGPPGPAGKQGPAGPPGEPGKDGKDAVIDEDALANRVAQIVLAQIDTPQPTSDAKYYVLVADNGASYWSRLAAELSKAQEGYSKIKVAQPPNYSVGALPQLVEYQSGKPLRTIAGSHDVSNALSYLARGATP